MAYYDTFMKVNRPPSVAMRQHIKEVVEKSFEVSSTYWEDIEIEDEFGTLEFRPIIARINRQIDYKVGEKSSDDYRKVLFQDLDFVPILGSRFRFDKNIWIVYSTNNTRSVTSSAYIRRCNQTINVQDKYGNIHREPCFIENSLINRNPTENEMLTTIKGNRTLYAQFNQWTTEYDIGHRFVFGNQSYKMINFAELQRNETFDDDTVRLLVCYIDIDEKSNYDRFRDSDGKFIGVADYKEFDFQIQTPTEIKGLAGLNATISSSLTLNNEVFEENLIYTSSDENIVIVDNLTGFCDFLSDGTATITVHMENKPEIFKEISVIVNVASDDNYENIVEPKNYFVALSQTNSYSVYETLNGIQTDTTFTITCDNMTAKHYELDVIDGNNFAITNKKENSNTLLEVKCTNDKDNSYEILFLELGGLF